MKTNHKKYFFLFFILAFFLHAVGVNAQTVNVDASKLLAHSELFLSPRQGSFTVGSTFQVPILINTKGTSINGVEVRIKFDKNKIQIIQPSGGNSIVGVWVEPPRYDNTAGTASYVGVIPNGIITGSGLIGMVTFKAISTGQAVVSFSSDSKIFLNDGLGTLSQVDLGRSEYTILSKPPEGLYVFSETHPSQSSYYNNNNAVVSWERESGVSGFSFTLDNQPSTIPDNTVDSDDTTAVFDSLNDGLWYFHIKASKNGVWGTVSHFLVRIDTTPPAEFTPEVNYLVAAVILINRTLLSFFTTDNLSGIDHYEVGIIDKTQPVTESPVFIQTDSPFQVPMNSSSNLKAIVRAVDKAGNVRDASVDVKQPFVVTQFIKDYLVYILLFIILAGLVALFSHYVFGRHIIRYFKRALYIAKKEEEAEKEKRDFPLQ